MNDGNGGKNRRQTLEGHQTTHRVALQIAGMLPDDTEEALAVLDRARFLLESWRVGFAEEQAQLDRTVTVLRPKLVGAD